MATKVRKVRKKVDRIDESELHSSLEKLNLSENPIACIPSAISVCSNLTKLVLRNCRLQELPSELGECRALTTIDVSGNELTRLPPELATLEKLSTLDVRSNQIKMIPMEYAKLRLMKKFFVLPNPILQPPSWICSKGTVQILRFLQSIASGQLSEAATHHYKLEASTEPLIPKKKRTAKLKLVKMGSLLSGKYPLSFTIDSYVYETIGSKTAMEDKCVQLPKVAQHGAVHNNVAYFGVYDGHGGKGCVDYLCSHLHGNILTQRFLQMANRMDKAGMKAHLPEAYLQTNQDFLKARSNDKSGSTATSLVLIENQLICASVGDSRAVLCRNGTAVRMSFDHKPSAPSEKSRIESLGGFVTNSTSSRGVIARTMGELAVSRSFGDRDLKLYVKPDPHIYDTILSPQDYFVIVASDGLWDEVDDQKAVEIVLKQADHSKAAEELTKTALARGSTDNICVLILYLLWRADRSHSRNSF